MEQNRLNSLVFVKYNLRLQQRHERRIAEGESYDPISLSDVESDDEWITEKEDPAFPANDHSWMDVGNEVDAYELEGASSTNKRKRGIIYKVF